MDTPENRRKMHGKIGEIAAQAYLERCGYRIADANVRFGRTGELDIVAWDRETLCFIEVKSRQGRPGSVAPAEAVTPSKQRQVARLAWQYALRNHLLSGAEEISLRFDVVAVTLDSAGLVAHIDLIQGAFFAPENLGE
jgi:putative endonuclease